MSRVINTQGVGKERNRLVKAIVISIRELSKQEKPDSKTRDLAAFIALALNGVADTIERTVGPWEKRDYWVKADRFRREWAWAGKLGAEMEKAALNEDWAMVAATAGKVATNLGNVQVSPRHRMGKPWEGAWEQLQLNNRED